MMKALHSTHSTTPKLQLCHRSPLFSKPSFLLTLLPLKHQHSLQNSRHFNTHKQKQKQEIPFIASSSLVSMAAAASSSDNASTVGEKPFAVLFVCLGNICRSPAAEGVFRDLVKKRDLDSNFLIDSAGTINYHEGNEADPRMRVASKRRGIQITSLSRPIKPSDFKEFDLILAMDKQNREDILAAFERWSFREALPADSYKKVKLMCSYCKKHTETEVPDPYYGGPQGFEKVLDLLEDACESLLGSILAGDDHISDS